MKLKTLLILAYVSIIFGACTVYTPNSVQTPSFRNKGEVQAGVMSGFSGTDISLAYAPTKYLGVFTGYNFIDNQDSSKIFKKNQFEIAAGYYSFNKRNNMTVEYFLGLTSGNLIDNKLDANLVVVDSNYVRYSAIFMQPDIGLTSKMGEISFTPRLNYYFLNSQQHGSVGMFVFQPTLNLGFGFKNLYFYVNQSLMLNFTDTNLNWFTLFPYNLNVGVRIKLFRIFDETSMY